MFWEIQLYKMHKWITFMFNLFINRLVYRKVTMWYWKTTSKRDSHVGRNKSLRGTSAKSHHTYTTTWHNQHTQFGLSDFHWTWTLKYTSRCGIAFWLIWVYFMLSVPLSSQNATLSNVSVKLVSQWLVILHYYLSLSVWTSLFLITWNKKRPSL